jgi:hypothetical protein
LFVELLVGFANGFTASGFGAENKNLPREPKNPGRCCGNQKCTRIVTAGATLILEVAVANGKPFASPSKNF